MLKINNLEVVYNDVVLVVRGISLEVPDAGIVALLGSNGAGKTTTLKAISKVLYSEEGKIEDGTIKFNEHLLNELSPEQIVRLGVCQVPEGRQVFDELTVDENLRIGAYTRKYSSDIRGDLKRIYDYFPVLAGRKDVLAVYLSGGEQQMIAIGRGLMSRPRLLMMDEPSLGLGPLVIAKIFEISKKVNREEDVSILLVEQNANLALNFSQYGYIMENGKIVLDGPAEKIMENEDIKEFYLGLTEVGKKKSYRNVKHYKRRKRWLS
ncbi:MAG: ABC transporter ATP-binding protein [Deltaproteobacteria bacterium]|nr:ABC transporter ATP-binding protein [Deltaproteobacteria bacterium]